LRVPAARRKVVEVGKGNPTCPIVNIVLVS